MPQTHKSHSSPAGSPSDVKFYMFPGSNSVRTAELMLAYKGIAYEEVILTPVFHVFQLPRHGFTGITAPAVKIDGRRVQTTREISRALDEIKPEPRLFPADPAQRVFVQEAERWGEQMQNALRRMFYCATRRDRSAFPSVIAAGHPHQRLLRNGASLLVRIAATRHLATDAAGRRDVAALPQRLDQIDAWIEAGVLNGDQLNAADFQIAPNVAGLLVFDDFAPLVEGRPAAAFAMRVAGRYRGHVGPVFPDDWLEPVKRAVQSRHRSISSAKASGIATAAGAMTA